MIQNISQIKVKVNMCQNSMALPYKVWTRSEAFSTQTKSVSRNLSCIYVKFNFTIYILNFFSINLVFIIFKSSFTFDKLVFERTELKLIIDRLILTCIRWKFIRCKSILTMITWTCKRYSQFKHLRREIYRDQNHRAQSAANSAA